MNRVVAPPVSAFFAAEHARHGVEIVTDAAVAALEGDGRVQRVVCADGRSLRRRPRGDRDRRGAERRAGARRRARGRQWRRGRRLRAHQRSGDLRRGRRDQSSERAVRSPPAPRIGAQRDGAGQGRRADDRGPAAGLRRRALVLVRPVRSEAADRGRRRPRRRADPARRSGDARVLLPASARRASGRDRLRQPRRRLPRRQEADRRAAADRPRPRGRSRGQIDDL